MQLNIYESHRVKFFQVGIALFILRRGLTTHLSSSPIFLKLVIEHQVPDLSAAPKRLRDEKRLLSSGINAVFERTIQIDTPLLN